MILYREAVDRLCVRLNMYLVSFITSNIFIPLRNFYINSNSVGTTVKKNNVFNMLERESS